MYSATYKQKKVIKLAPDAVVRINGDFRVTICPKCKTSINLSDYITTVASSLPVNSTIGNAQFSIAMPRHGDDGNFMVRGGKVHGIELMDEVEIFIKGRYPTNRNGNYQYYKVFWGVITSIGETYNAGVQEVSVSCESMLKWFQLMRTNVHPANLHQADFNDEQVGVMRNAWSGVNFSNMDPYQIIYYLTKVTMNNMVIPSRYDTEKSLETPKDYKGNKVTDRKYYTDVQREKLKKSVISNWQDKFNSIRNALKMFGTTSDSFNEKTNSNFIDIKNKAISPGGQKMASATKATTAADIRVNAKALMDFSPFAYRAKDVSLPNVTSTYKTNLEIINEIRLYTGYEFYQDTNGDIIFKPPFWNLDTEPNPVYKIKDSDIITWDFQESEEAVVTRVEVTGTLNRTKKIDTPFPPIGIFTNYALSRKFGLRTHPLGSEVLSTPYLCYQHAIDEMDRINANIYRGSLTIVGRPELRLGYPVYIESRDIYGYIENISHNFAFGGPFTTQIHLTSIRKKYLGNDTKSEGYAFEDDSSRNIKGDSVILVYTGDDSFFKNLDTTVDSSETKKYNQQPLAKHNKLPHDKQERVANLKTNRAGSYKEISLRDPEAQAILKKLDAAKISENTNSYLSFLDEAIPVSDELGYELIGTFEYGRTLYLDRSGTIKKKANSFSKILANSLKKINKLSDYSGNDSFTEFGVMDDPVEETATLQNDSIGVNKKANTVKEVADFHSYKSYKLSEIAPDRDKQLNKGCSCFDSDLKSKSYKDKNQNNKQSTISSTSNRNKK